MLKESKEAMFKELKKNMKTPSHQIENNIKREEAYK